MSRPILSGLRLVEGSAFVAAPLGGMTLAQLGAEVIRFDQIGGGPDAQRWPLDAHGNSLFWAGLNKGKRSIQIALTTPEGQELASELIARIGTFLTNFPARGWLAYETLRKPRDDLVMVVLSGNPDGSSEVDYTVNPAIGFPGITGPRGDEAPVNSVLPAWDVAAGTLCAVGLLAAERRRTAEGIGSLVQLALSDVALAVTGALGRLAQADLGLATDKPDGNYLYGAFGRDFATRDGRRVMVVGLTARQWQALRKATATEAAMATLAEHSGLDLDEEGARYAARDAIAAILEPWFATRTFAEVSAALDAAGASWGPYQTFAQLVREDPRASTANPLLGRVAHPGSGAYLTPRSPLAFSDAGAVSPAPAPAPGQHTDEVLADVLGLSSGTIGRLHERGVVAGPTAPNRG